MISKNWRDIEFVRYMTIFVAEDMLPYERHDWYCFHCHGEMTDTQDQNILDILNIWFTHDICDIIIILSLPAGGEVVMCRDCHRVYHQSCLKQEVRKDCRLSIS